MKMPLAELYLPAGTYRITDLDLTGNDLVWSQFLQADIDKAAPRGSWTTPRPSHLFINKAGNLTIRGDGPDKTTLVLAGPPVKDGIYLYRCANTYLEGISLDYDPLPQTQGRVSAIVSPLQYEVTIDEGFPEPTAEHISKIPNLTVARFMVPSGGGFIDNPDTTSHFSVKSVEKVGENVFRIGIPPEDAQRLGKDATCLGGSRVIIYGRPRSTKWRRRTSGR